MKFGELVNLEDRIQRYHNMDKVANFILNTCEYRDNYEYSAVPIVNILYGFGIKLYKTTAMLTEERGVLYIGGKTNEVYGVDKVAFIDSLEDSYKQRYTAAYLFGKYILEYLELDNKKILYDAYELRDREEDRIDVFVRNLLLPNEEFREQYLLAINETNNLIYTHKYLAKLFQVEEAIVERKISGITGIQLI